MNKLGRNSLFYFTQNEAAKYLGISQPTFSKLVKRGAICGKRRGVGTEREHFKFSADDLDRFQVDRAKEKLGDRFDDLFSKARIVVSFFQSFNDGRIATAIAEGRDIHYAYRYYRIEPLFLPPESLKNTRNTCKDNEKPILEHVLSIYYKIPKSLKVWIDNQIHFHADYPTIEFKDKPVFKDEPTE